MVKLTKRESVEWIFENRGLPGWLGWGTMGAESTYGATSSGHFFGLIEPSYNGVAPNNNWEHDAEISADLYKSLVHQYGSIAAAVPHYSGNSYTVSHVEALGKVPGRKLEGANKGVGSYAKQLVKEGKAKNLKEAEKMTEENSTADGSLGAVTGVHVPNPLSPLSAVVGFLGRLFEPSFWLRVGKGILGLILLIFGAATLMKVLVGVDVPTGVPTAAKLAKTFAA